MPHTWGPKAGRQFQRAQAAVPAASTATPAVAAARRRVLFVCIGNSCRSQMAEGFALRYGADVMEAMSAGLAPASLVAPLTRKAMLEHKRIDLSAHWPKSIFEVTGPFDIIVNLSGEPLPPQLRGVSVRTWAVDDPVLGDEAVQLAAAEKIEGLVQQLILELRGGRASR
ncbi:MAG: hypothetical protein IT162_20120 [Bryobacterales bacterium]|nr:hypothetical protein [Bryobacterales bacterium]